AGPAGPAFDDCVAGLPAGISAAVAALLSDHVAVTAARFDQVRLSLAAGGRAPNHGRDHARDRGSPTSEELLAEPGSPRLTERLFDAGRYAILSSTGALPPTLQGVWSGDYDPPWRSGYTLNGNLPTALALAVPTGQPDLLLPLFDLLDQMMDDFRENARRLYGARGILLPTHCSSHGKQNHFGPIWCQTFWTAAAAWMARFYFDYWRATGDSAFLAERALPFMVEAASFYEDFLVERGGHTAFIPSYSPENEPAGTGTQAAINATLDVAAVRDLFRNLIECQSALNQNDPRLTHWRTVLESLPRFATGANGELAEWVWAGLLDNHAHRHASHLYPLWYADPDLLADPALCAAAAATIQRRLAWWRGDATGIEQPGEMAFGLVGLGLAAARLGLADVAFEILGKLEQDYWRPSLVSTHNAGSIFNVDLCGGFVALVLSMLISTGRETIDLLPAVPSAWQRGEITGIAGCDQVTVTRLSWTPEHVEVELAAAVERRIMIGFASTPATHRRVPVTVRPGQPLHLVASRQPASTGVTPDCDIP
ncbi:MAG: hypothetical protein JXA67_02515, partial [Micromonosporaceae bacterium]|nr:hypothetical protein [Micromonosporaceae bacterium]